jgi:hypothetical protein
MIIFIVSLVFSMFSLQAQTGSAFIYCRDAQEQKNIQLINLEISRLFTTKNISSIFVTSKKLRLEPSDIAIECSRQDELLYYVAKTARSSMTLKPLKFPLTADQIYKLKAEINQKLEIKASFDAVALLKNSEKLLKKKSTEKLIEKPETLKLTLNQSDPPQKENLQIQVPSDKFPSPPVVKVPTSHPWSQYSFIAGAGFLLAGRLKEIPSGADPLGLYLSLGLKKPHSHSVYQLDLLNQQWVQNNQRLASSSALFLGFSPELISLNEWLAVRGKMMTGIRKLEFSLKEKSISNISVSSALSLVLFQTLEAGIRNEVAIKDLGSPYLSPMIYMQFSWKYD